MESDSIPPVSTSSRAAWRIRSRLSGRRGSVFVAIDRSYAVRISYAVNLHCNERRAPMQAVVHNRFGSPTEVLELEEIEKPEPADDDVLRALRPAALNPVDCSGRAGRPYVARPIMGLLKPKDRAVGMDFAGTVEAVGRDVTKFRPGDEVFGRSGAFSEYVCVSESVAPKPADLTFEQAAAVPVAAITALQGLRDHGQLQPGQKALINGASGGVGTFAVQIAKALGAEVTAVCSTRNVEQARSLGADRVIDYMREDFTRGSEGYDVILDVAGTRSWSRYRRVMNPRATLVIVGGPKTNPLLGPLGHVIRVLLAAWRGSQKAVFFVANLNEADLEVLRELLESGKVTPAIVRRYEVR